MKKILAALVVLFATLALAKSSDSPRLQAGIDLTKPLVLKLSPGDYEIVAGQSQNIAIAYSTKDPNQMKKVQVRIGDKGNRNFLRISGPKNNFRVRIEVPRLTNLQVRLSAGELRMEGVEGDKDIEMRVGDLNIDVLRPEMYGKIDASARIGDVDSGPFNMPRHGLVGSAFKAMGQGPYRFHAHVGIGDVRLYATEPEI